MPIDKPQATAAPTTRRTFLARAAVGSALVGVGGAVGPLGLFSSAAGAQVPSGDLPAPPALDAEAFAAFAVPLEMAAVQAYQSALSGDRLDDEWSELALRFQGHHQQVVDALTELLAADAGTPTANETVLGEAESAISGGADQNAVLTALSELEGTIAATHLYAMGGIEDAPLAKTVAQVLAVESQQSAALGLAGGGSIADLAPDAVTTDGARTDLSEGAVTATTTTAPGETGTEDGGGADAGGTGSGTEGESTGGAGGTSGSAGDTSGEEGN
ncbi:MAG TPA: ferritin-like domain-containing protein [Aquihabitans sp.]|nr:ferritin-like domain-containing protein [Aquihabitans sp.]